LRVVLVSFRRRASRPWIDGLSIGWFGLNGKIKKVGAGARAGRQS
jgi:hypothetical protein